MSGQQEFGWLDTILNLYRRDIERHYGGKTVGNTLNGDEAKAAIIEHFTAQTQPLPSIHMNDVNGIDCPACGHPTLMLMSGNYITCCMADCPNPDYTDALAKQQQAELLRARKEATEANNDLHKRHEDNLTVVHRIELLRARIETNKEILKFIPALQKHSGASWQRGYVSAQQTLRNNIKKNIAYLQAELDKLEGERDE